MWLGELELHTVSGGRFRSDGGTMFGVVPKALWKQRIECDENNTIPQATNCVLVRGRDYVALIDTGYGPKLSDAARRWMSAERGAPLIRSLEALGVRPEEVTHVILSHLHADHAGGASEQGQDQQLRLVFAHAEHIVQRLEWDTATAGLPELSAAYPQEHVTPLKERLRLVEGEQEILPGIRALPTPGHTAGHQSLVIESGGRTAIYLGDLCPTWNHLPSLWCMSYDVDLLETRRRKPAVLGLVADQGWLALSCHDPARAAVRLRRDKRRDFVVEEAFATLDDEAERSGD